MRRATQRQADAESAWRASEVAERLARELGEKHSARRAVLFGSLTRGDFGAGSDIDLAAEGIPDRDFFRAGAHLDAAAGGLSLDLVPIESADGALLATLSRHGLVL